MRKRSIDKEARELTLGADVSSQALCVAPDTPEVVSSTPATVRLLGDKLASKTRGVLALALTLLGDVGVIAVDDSNKRDAQMK